jgi:hypothetical protein
MADQTPPPSSWSVPYQPQQSPVGWQVPPQIATPGRGSFVEQNRITLTVLAVVVGYLVLAVTTRVVFLGVFPVMMSMRAMKRREPLGVLAVAAAGAAVVMALIALQH